MDPNKRIAPPGPAAAGGPPRGPPMSPFKEGERPTKAETLSLKVLDRLVTGLGLEELHGEDGGDYMVAKAPGGPFAGDTVCKLRVFNGPGVSKVIYNQLILDKMGLDAHMVFAFTPLNSAVPHFTLDSIKHPRPVPHAFHIDLIPRVDLGTDLGYMDQTYGPLTAAREAFMKEHGAGLEKADLSLRQFAVMSPWMMASQASAESFVGLEAPVMAYLEHWLKLVNEGYSDDVNASLAGVDTAVRDAKHRKILFDPVIDPVWNQVDRMVGKEISGKIQDILKIPTLLAK